MLMQIGDTFGKPTSKSCRSSPPVAFLGKSVLKICSKFTGEHPCQSVISRKVALLMLILHWIYFCRRKISGTGVKYTGYVISTFRNATVVFDGYPENVTTTDNTNEYRLTCYFKEKTMNF